MSKNINIQMKQFNGVDYDNIYPVGENKIGDIVFTSERFKEGYALCDGSIMDANEYPEYAKVCGKVEQGYRYTATPFTSFGKIERYFLFPDDSLLVMSTQEVGIWKTTDRGNTFKQVYSGSSSGPNFIQLSTGEILTADAYKILQSKNKGDSWTVVSEDSSRARVAEWIKLEDDSILALRASGVVLELYKSTDKGVSWSKLQLEGAPQINSGEFFLASNGNIILLVNDFTKYQTHVYILKQNESNFHKKYSYTSSSSKQVDSSNLIEYDNQISFLLKESTQNSVRVYSFDFGETWIKDTYANRFISFIKDGIAYGIGNLSINYGWTVVNCIGIGTYSQKAYLIRFKNGRILSIFNKNKYISDENSNIVIFPKVQYAQDMYAMVKVAH